MPSPLPPPLWPSARTSGGCGSGVSVRPQKVLVLDLDHTLLCTNLSPTAYATPPAFSELVATAHGAELYHVWLRPHLQLFLTALSRLYNIVIFTASSPQYADAIVDRIDANERRIKRRYFRNHCTPLLSDRAADGGFSAAASFGAGGSGRFGKDLSVLDVPLRSVVMVDNDPDALSLNDENGLLISSYYPPRRVNAAASPNLQSPMTGTPAAPAAALPTLPVAPVDADEELLALLPLLEALFYVTDVRSVLRLARR